VKAFVQLRGILSRRGLEAEISLSNHAERPLAVLA